MVRWHIKETRLNLPAGLMFLKFSFKVKTLSHCSSWPLNVEVSQSLVLDSFFPPYILSLGDLIHLMFSNAIYMLIGYKFISLDEVSFLSSRPLCLKPYSITPLGGMTGTSDPAYLKQNSWLCHTTLQPHIFYSGSSPRLPGDTTPFH